MLGDNKHVKTFLTLGAIALAFTSIAGFYHFFYPKVNSKAVEISDVRLQQAAGPRSTGACESQIIVSFKIKIDGYPGQPVKLYTRIDDSAPPPSPDPTLSPSLDAALPCPPPFGAWDGWQHAKDVRATVQTQTLQIDLPVTLYLRKENRTIQLQATDMNDQVLAKAVSPVFSSK